MKEDQPSVRLAFSQDGQSWDNEVLLQELRSGEPSRDTGLWAIWNWQEPLASPAPLEIAIFVPEHHYGSSAAYQFLAAVSNQLERSFSLFCAERGWPPPGYRLLQRRAEGGRWAYRIRLPGGPVAEGPLKPAKLLVMGGCEQMASLLGLEAVDPFLGLPAKWVARSQLEKVRAADIHAFDGPGLVAAHTLHLVGEIWHRSFGFLELQRWLMPCLPTHGELLKATFPVHAGLFSRALKDLVADRLWLPPAGTFLEIFLEALLELEAESPLPPGLCAELMRKQILPLNLDRFTDPLGALQAVEWRGEPEGDHYAQLRMMTRLAAALREGPGAAVVLTDELTRLGLSQVLRTSFPQLPVLSWTELPTHATVSVVAVVNARFEVDPSRWPQASYTVEMEPGSRPIGQATPEL